MNADVKILALVGRVGAARDAKSIATSRVKKCDRSFFARVHLCRLVKQADIFSLSPAVPARRDVETDFVAFLQAANPGTRGRRHMAKDVSAAVITLYEAIASVANHFNFSEKH
jgi:hypothetical protein